MITNDILKVKDTKLINGNDTQFDFFTINTKDIKNNSFFIPLKGKTDGHDYILDGVQNGIKGFFIEKDHKNIIKKAIKINKNVTIIETNDNLKALQSLAKLVRKKINVPVIALTGSYGKTSQREMIYSVIKSQLSCLKTESNYNNHIGMPLTLVNYNNEDTILLELGSNHLGEIAFLRDICKPTITIVTNIGTAHIGNFKNIKNTTKEKLSIAKGCEYFFRNQDSNIIKKAKIKENVIDYGITYDGIYNIIKGKKTRYTINIDNKKYKITINSDIDYLINYSLCALKIGLLLNLDMKSIIKGIDNFKCVQNRMEKKMNGKFFVIDDCYNASYETMISGIEYFNNLNCKNKVVVLGDILELGKLSKKIHLAIAKDINKLHPNFKEIHLVGPKMEVAYNYLIKKGFKIFYYKNVDDVNINFKNNNVYLKASHGVRLSNLIN